MLSSGKLHAEDPYLETILIEELSEEPKIDGIIEKSIWNSIKEYSLQKSVGRHFLKQPTFVKMGYKGNHLFIILEVVEKDFKDLEQTSVALDSEKIFDQDCIELFMQPQNANRYFQVVLNYNGDCYDAMFNLNNKKVDKTWSCGAKIGIGETKSFLLNRKTIELKIPLENIFLNDFEKDGLRFNLIRTRTERAITEENSSKKKIKKIIENACEGSLFKIGNTSHNYTAFGLITTKNTTPKKDNPQKLADQILLTGGLSQIASMDVYFKATNNFMGLIPEGCEVGHGATLRYHEHIPVSQWTVKMDGYMRTGLITGEKDYQELASQILDKLIKILEVTVDKDGKSWIPIWGLVDQKGKSNGYGAGPTNMRGIMGVPYNQSKAKYNIASNGFDDSFGLGFYDISQLELEQNFKNRLLTVLEAQLNFYHRDYFLVNDSEGTYWRSDDFSPANPEAPTKKNSWLIGSDIVYCVLAYHNLGGLEKEKYLEILTKFSKYYISLRKKLGVKKRENSSWTNMPLWRIEFLDNRMLDVVKYVQTKKIIGFTELENFILKELKNLYSDDYHIEFAIDGLTAQSDATTPLIYLFTSIDEKRFNDIWRGFIHGGLTNQGAIKGKSIPGMNGSSYPTFLIYAYNAWVNKKISDDELIYAVKKIYTIFGSPGFAKTTKDWNQEIMEHNKKEPHWIAVPDECYVDSVMPESIWQTGETQGYIKNWFAAHNNQLKPYEDPSQMVYKNSLYQFTAPFQSHGEPFSYGQAFTFNLLKLKAISKEASHWMITFEKPILPKRLPCFGVVNVTDLLYQQKSFQMPTKKKITKVSCDETALPFKLSGINDFTGAYTFIDNEKLIFILPEHAPGLLEIKISFEVKNE